MQEQLFRSVLVPVYASETSAMFFLLLLVIEASVSVGTESASFEPYELNGGLVSAVAGRRFGIVAADTRMFGPGGYLLNSRDHLAGRLWGAMDNALLQDLEGILRKSDGNRKEEDITFSCQEPPIFIGAAGCSADCQALQLNTRADLRAANYFYLTGEELTNSPTSRKKKASEVATVLGQILYLRRGFPYYCFCVVSAIGKAYVYDAIGSYEEVAVATAGTGREALQPILDRAFSTTSSQKQVTETVEQAVQIIYHAYRAVSEREIGVGDKLVLCVSEEKKDGVATCRVIILPLKEH